jgi:nucleoside-diphosphate-sugar epimerase
VGGVVSIFGRHALRGEPIIIYGDGTQLRSFTYVEDVVRINQLAALDPRMTGQAYNCASGVKVTIAELARAVLAHLSRADLPIVFKDWRPGDIKTFDVNNSKLKALGFDFRWSFQAGLAATLDDLRRHLGGG